MRPDQAPARLPSAQRMRAQGPIEATRHGPRTRKSTFMSTAPRIIKPPVEADPMESQGLVTADKYFDSTTRSPGTVSFGWASRDDVDPMRFINKQRGAVGPGSHESISSLGRTPVSYQLSHHGFYFSQAKRPFGQQGHGKDSPGPAYKPEQPLSPGTRIGTAKRRPLVNATASPGPMYKPTFYAKESRATGFGRAKRFK